MYTFEMKLCRFSLISTEFNYRLHVLANEQQIYNRYTYITYNTTTTTYSTYSITFTYTLLQYLSNAYILPKSYQQV